MNAVPTAVKKARGTYNKHFAVSNEPELSLHLPPEPEGMDAAELKEWRKLAEKVMLLRVITEADELALEQLARLSVKVRMLAIKVRDDQKAKKPINVREHSQLSKGLRDLGRWLGYFGLHPAGRAKVNAVPPTPEERKAKAKGTMDEFAARK